MLLPGIAKLCLRNDDFGSPSDACSADNSILFGNYVLELIVTFVFVSVVLSIKYTDGSKDILINALSIGLTLFGL